MINKNVLIMFGGMLLSATTASLAIQQMFVKQTHLETQHQDFAPQSSSKIYSIDLEETNSVENLLQKFNSITNVFMPESVLELTKPSGFLSLKISEKSFDKLKKYTKNINFQYEKILFRFKQNAYEVDLMPIKKQIDIIRKKLDVNYSKVLSTIQATNLITSTMSKAPNMVALLKDMTGLGIAMKMAPMGSIPDKGFLTYLEMMEAYHSFSWHFSQSTAYKNWVSEKNISYKLIKNSKIEYVAHNEGYDRQSNKIIAPSPNKPQEINNLEAQLVLSLTNLYGIAN